MPYQCLYTLEPCQVEYFLPNGKRIQHLILDIPITRHALVGVDIIEPSQSTQILGVMLLPIVNKIPPIARALRYLLQTMQAFI